MSLFHSIFSSKSYEKTSEHPAETYAGDELRKSHVISIEGKNYSVIFIASTICAWRTITQDRTHVRCLSSMSQIPKPQSQATKKAGCLRLFPPATYGYIVSNHQCIQVDWITIYFIS